MKSKLETFVQLINNEGWFTETTNIRKIFSPNFDKRPQGVSPFLIVLHNISLPVGEFGNDNVEKLFLNKLDTSSIKFKKLKNLKVSSHFYIKRTGHINQFVSIYKRAWHAGRSNFKGQENCNDFSIGIELEGSDFVSYEISQYESLIFLIKTLKKEFTEINSITSHEYISPLRKTDPGPHFDWEIIKKNFRDLSICWEVFTKEKEK